MVGSGNRYFFNDWTNGIDRTRIMDMAQNRVKAEQRAQQWATPELADKVAEINRNASWTPIGTVLSLSRANASAAAQDASAQLAALYLAREQAKPKKRQSFFDKYIYGGIKQSFRVLQAAAEFPSDIINNIASQAVQQAGSGPLGFVESFLPQNLFSAFGKGGWFKSTQLGGLIEDWDKQGEGFILSEELNKINGERARQFRGEIGGHAWTLGRANADVLFTPGSVAYNVMSGLMDATVELGTDPTNLLSSTSKVGKLRRSLTEVPLMSKEEATAAARIAAGVATNTDKAYWNASKTAEWLNKSGAAGRTMEVIAKTKSPYQIMKAFGFRLPPEVAKAMSLMDDPEQIKAALGALTSPYGLVDSVTDEAVQMFNLDPRHMVRSFVDVPGSKRLFNSAWRESTVGIAYNKWFQTSVPKAFLQVRGTSYDRANAVKNLANYLDTISTDISTEEWMRLLDWDTIKKHGVPDNFLRDIVETTPAGKPIISKKKVGNRVVKSYKFKEGTTTEEIKTAFLDFAVTAYSDVYGTKTAVKRTGDLFNLLAGSMLRSSGVSDEVVTSIIKGIDGKTEEFRRYFVKKVAEGDDDNLLKVLANTGIIPPKAVRAIVDDPAMLDKLRIVGPMALMDLLTNVQVLPDPRVLRRLSAPMWRKELQKVVVNQAGELRGGALVVDYVQNQIWKPLALASGGYIMRNLLDGQLRMALTGDVYGLFNSPLKYVTTALGFRNKGNILGQSWKGAKNLTDSEEAASSSIRALDDIRHSSVSKSMIDPVDGSAAMIRSGEVRLVERQLDRNLHTQAIADSMAAMRRDVIARLLLEGKQTDEIITILENSRDGKQAIVDLIAANVDGYMVAKENGIKQMIPFEKNWYLNETKRREYLRNLIDYHYKTDRLGWLLAPETEDLRFAAMHNRVPVGPVEQMLVDSIEESVVNGNLQVVQGPGMIGRGDKVGKGSILAELEIVDEAGEFLPPKYYMVVNTSKVNGKDVFDIRQVRMRDTPGSDPFQAFAPDKDSPVNSILAGLIDEAGDAGYLPQTERWFDRQQADRVAANLGPEGELAKLGTWWRDKVDWWFVSIVDEKFMANLEKDPFWRQYYYKNVIGAIDTLAPAEARKLIDNIVAAAEKEGVNPARYVGSKSVWKSIQREVDKAEGKIDMALDTTKATIDDLNDELTEVDALIRQIEDEIKEVRAAGVKIGEAGAKGNYPAFSEILKTKLRHSTVLSNRRPISHYAGDKPLGHIYDYLRGVITLDELHTIPVAGRGELFKGLTDDDVIQVAGFFQDPLRASKDVRKKIAENARIKSFVSDYVDIQEGRAALDTIGRSLLSNGSRVRDYMGPEPMRHILNWLDGNITLDELEKMPVRGKFIFDNITKEDGLKVAAFVRSFDEPAAVEAMSNYLKGIITLDELHTIPVRGRGQIFFGLSDEEVRVLARYKETIDEADELVDIAEAIVPERIKAVAPKRSAEVEAAAKEPVNSDTQVVSTKTNKTFTVSTVGEASVSTGASELLLIKNNVLKPGYNKNQFSIIDQMRIARWQRFEHLRRMGKAKLKETFSVWVKADYLAMEINDVQGIRAFTNLPPNANPADYVEFKVYKKDALKFKQDEIQKPNILFAREDLYDPATFVAGKTPRRTIEQGNAAAWIDRIRSDSEFYMEQLSIQGLDTDAVTKQVDDFIEEQRDVITTAQSGVGTAPVPPALDDDFVVRGSGWRDGEESITDTLRLGDEDVFSSHVELSDFDEYLRDPEYGIRVLGDNNEEIILKGEDAINLMAWKKQKATKYLIDRGEPEVMSVWAQVEVVEGKQQLYDDLESIWLEKPTDLPDFMKVQEYKVYRDDILSAGPPGKEKRWNGKKMVPADRANGTVQLQSLVPVKDFKAKGMPRRDVDFSPDLKPTTYSTISNKNMAAIIDRASTDPEYRAGLLDHLDGRGKGLPEETTDLPDPIVPDRSEYWSKYRNSPTPRDYREQELYNRRQELYHRRARLLGSRKDATEKAAEAIPYPNVPTGTLEDLDSYAGFRATAEMRNRFFDTAEKNNAMDALRTIAPFGAAWSSILGDYMKLFIEDPTRIRRAQRAYVGIGSADPLETGEGFFHRDPITGKNSFVFPLSGALSELFTGLNAPLQAPVQRLSVGYTFIPSLGPAAQIAADSLFRAAGDPPSLDFLAEIALPYGRGRGVAQQFIPGWLDKGLQALRGNTNELNTVFANTYMETMRALASTGKYNLSNQADIDRLLADAKGKAKVLTGFRALSQFLGPTAGTTAFKVDTVKGQDIYASELIKEFYKLQSENYDTAVQRFLEIHGENAMLYMSGKSRAKQSGLEATEQFGDWERSNRGFLERYGDVGAYFAPGGDDFSFATWERQIRSGKRERLTDREILEEAQNRIGSARYREARMKVGANPTREQELWLSEFRGRLAEQYPGFPRVAVFEVGRFESNIDQLKLAVQDKSVRSTPVAKAISTYLTYRDQALAELNRYGFTTFKSDTAKPIANWLAGIAYQIMLGTPEFGRLFDRVLAPEVED